MYHMKSAYLMEPSLTLCRESGSDSSWATVLSTLRTIGSLTFSQAMFSSRTLFWNGVSRNFSMFSWVEKGARMDRRPGFHIFVSRIIFLLEWIRLPGPSV